MNTTIFLGGTCNDPDWRPAFIEMLKECRLDFFNPKLEDHEDWDNNAQAKEREAREECDYCLYVITPSATGAYSIAEAVDDSNKRPHKTILCALREHAGEVVDDSQWNSLLEVGNLIIRNRACFCTTLEEVIEFVRPNSSLESLISFKSFKPLLK